MSDVEQARVISRAEAVAADRLRALHVPDPEKAAGELVTALLNTGLRPSPAVVDAPPPARRSSREAREAAMQEIRSVFDKAKEQR